MKMEMEGILSSKLSRGIYNIYVFKSKYFFIYYRQFFSKNNNFLQIFFWNIIKILIMLFGDNQCMSYTCRIYIKKSFDIFIFIYCPTRSSTRNNRTKYAVTHIYNKTTKITRIPSITYSTIRWDIGKSNQWNKSFWRENQSIFVNVV